MITYDNNGYDSTTACSNERLPRCDCVTTHNLVAKVEHDLVTKVEHNQLLQLVVASMRMCDLYIQTNDLVIGFWFADDLDACVTEVSVSQPSFLVVALHDAGRFTVNTPWCVSGSSSSFSSGVKTDFTHWITFVTYQTFFNLFQMSSKSYCFFNISNLLWKFLFSGGQKSKKIGDGVIFCRRTPLLPSQPANKKRRTYVNGDGKNFYAAPHPSPLHYRSLPPRTPKAAGSSSVGNGKNVAPPQPFPSL